MILGGSDEPQGSSSWRVSGLNPLRVRMDGQSAHVYAKTLTSYTPVVGDVVATLPLDVSRRLILGKIA